MLDDSTTISWETMYKIEWSWLDVLICTSFYLESCIWPDAILRGTRQRNSIKFCKIAEKVQWRPWQWLDKHLEKKAWTIHGKPKLTNTEKQWDRLKAKSRSLTFKVCYKPEYILLNHFFILTCYFDKGTPPTVPWANLEPPVPFA
jgi:hypothetical protein